MKQVANLFSIFLILATFLYSPVLGMEGDSLESLIGKGEASLDSERFGKAVEFYMRAFKIDQNDSVLCYNLALSFEYLEQPGKAYLFYELYLDLEPDAEDTSEVEAWLSEHEPDEDFRLVIEKIIAEGVKSRRDETQWQLKIIYEKTTKVGKKKKHVLMGKDFLYSAPNYSIYSMNVDGSDKKLLLNDAYYHSIANKAGLIAYYTVYHEDGKEMKKTYISRLDGTDAVEPDFEVGSHGNGELALSPDGKYAAYVTKYRNNWELAVYEFDFSGGGTVRLISKIQPKSQFAYSIIIGPRFEQDGKKLCYGQDRWDTTKAGQYYRDFWYGCSDVDGSNFEALKYSGYNLSRENLHLHYFHMFDVFFDQNANVENIVNSDYAKEYELVLVNDTRGEAKIVKLGYTDKHTVNHFPIFSPDGEKVVFSSMRDGHGSFDVYSINADGSEMNRLTMDNEMHDVAMDVMLLPE